MSFGADAPDYQGAAEQQAQSSKEVTNMQTWANRPTQVTPWGTQSWTPDAQIDPATGQPVTHWTQQTTLDPRLQEALDSQIAAQGGRSQMAEDLLPQTRDKLLKPLTDWSGDAGANAMYGQLTSRLDPQWQQREDQARAQLAGQGLDPGTDAWNAQYDALMRSRNDAYTSANRESTLYGNQYAAGKQALELADRTSSLNLMNAALNGQQVAMPSMPGFSQAAASQPVQALDAANMQFQANQAQQQNIADMIGGASSMAGGLMMFSDERLKDNIIRYRYEVIPGVHLASWLWKGKEGPRQYGVIAQDVEKVRPDLVIEFEGYKAVNYGGLL